MAPAGLRRADHEVEHACLHLEAWTYLGDAQHHASATAPRTSLCPQSPRPRSRCPSPWRVPTARSMGRWGCVVRWLYEAR